MNTWQNIINGGLAIIVTLLIYQNEQLKDDVDTLNDQNILNLDAYELRFDEEVVDAVKYIVEYNCYTEAQGIVMRCDKLTKYE
tara:strand:- start:278 stop:526 length:249 start_codon:yes stop_codon:yes gene_type:complete